MGALDPGSNPWLPSQDDQSLRLRFQPRNSYEFENGRSYVHSQTRSLKESARWCSSVGVEGTANARGRSLAALEADLADLESLSPVVESDLELGLCLDELVPAIPGVDLLDADTLPPEDLEDGVEYVELHVSNLLTHPLQIGTLGVATSPRMDLGAALKTSIGLPLCPVLFDLPQYPQTRMSQ